MLARWFGKEKTRLEKNPESQEVILHLAALNYKEKELHKSARRLGASSLAFGKHVIISALLRRLEAAVKVYNSKPVEDKEIVETQVFVGLLRELEKNINQTNQNPEHRRIISQFRSHEALYKFFGAKSADTSGLLDNFQQTLNATVRNLILSINIKQLDGDNIHLSEEDNMVCPITGQLMDNPVLLTLDGFSYEKEALSRWLTKERNSPMNRNSMPEHAEVKDVIVENRVLKRIIDEYKLYKQERPAKPQAESKAESKALSV